jgi:hypothetical protein
MTSFIFGIAGQIFTANLYLPPKTEQRFCYTVKNKPAAQIF